MKIKYLACSFVFCLTLFTFVGSSRTSKDSTDFINFAIKDFVNSNDLVKKDSAFYVKQKKLSNDVVGVSIAGTVNKPFVVKDGEKINTDPLPTNYIELSGKLFFWYDETNSRMPDLISELKKFKFIDTAISGSYIPVWNIDETRKVDDYYFCFKNSRKFKKVQTTQVMGHYPIPIINCD